MGLEPEQTEGSPLPSSAAPAPSEAKPERRVHRRRRRKRVTDHAPSSHTYCDTASEWLLFLLVVFPPWCADIWPNLAPTLTNLIAYVLGGLWLAKIWIRYQEGYVPQVWGGPPRAAEEDREDIEYRPLRDLPLTTAILGICTILLLGWVAFTLVNARGNFDPGSGKIVPLTPFAPWLPGSEDRAGTWSAFCFYLALAAAFWSGRDWLMHRVGRDGKESRKAAGPAPALGGDLALPYRWRRLLWVITANGAVLAAVSILHRASGTSEVLWLQPHTPPVAGGRAFGPWNYATHAAQYFNLVWPACLAFWVWLHERAIRSVDARKARIDGPQLVLIPFMAVTATATLMSDGQGGMLMATVCGLAVIVLALLVSRREASRFARWGLIACTGAGGLVFGATHWSYFAEQAGRVDRRISTGLDVRNGDFTLLARLNLANTQDGGLHPLLSLGGGSDGPIRSNALQVAVMPDGGPRASLVGVSQDQASHYSVAGLGRSGTNRESVLAIVRQGNLRIFLDGTELAGAEHETGTGPGGRGPVQSRYLGVYHPAVREVALANFAFQRDELATAQRTAFGGLAKSLVTGPLNSRDLAADTNALQLAAGTQGAIGQRPSQPGVRWLTLRRGAGGSTLGFTRLLTDVDSRLHNASHVTVKVWNQSDAPLHLSASLRAGLRSTVPIAPLAEAHVSIPLVPGGGRGEPTLEFAVTDAEGGDTANLPAGTVVFLRDLQLQSVRTVFAGQFEDDATLGLLRDHFAGRSELAHTARRMAADHGLLGAGAGTFPALHSRYRSADQQPALAARDDWLELRITLGWFGVAIVLVALACLALKVGFEPGAPTLGLVLAVFWIGPAACLVHARFDLPFHDLPVAFLFVLLAAAGSMVTPVRRP